jgi:hypothetical protein
MNKIQSKSIAALPFENLSGDRGRISPPKDASRSVRDQLNVYPHLIRRFLNCSFEDVGHAEFIGDLG